MPDPKLDSIQGCIAELTEINVEIAGFAAAWAEDAGYLKESEAQFKRLWTAGLRGTKGSNADERAATASAAVEQAAPGLAERIEDLVGKVEQHKILFNALERRASNAQSILSMHREASRLEPFVPPEMAGSGRQRGSREG